MSTPNDPSYGLPGTYDPTTGQAYGNTTYNQTPTPGTSGELNDAQKSERYWQEREREKEELKKKRKKYSKQDQAQLDQSLYPQEHRGFKKDIAQYGKDEKRYKKELKIYEEKKKEYEKDLAIWKSDKAKYDKELKEYNDLVAKYEKQKLEAEKYDARWYVVPSFQESKAGEKYKAAIDRYRDWQRRGVTKTVDQKYRELHGTSYIGYWRDAMQKEYQKKWGNQIKHNDKLNQIYGGRPQVSVGNIGVLQRTSADIIQGKSNVPLKQVSSSIQRQVRLYYLGQRYKNTSMTLNEFYSAKASILQTVYEKQSAEQARRNWHSAIQAKSAAAKASEKHQLMLKDMNKQNRLNQMSAQTAQNKLVASKAGITLGQSKLQQAKGKLQTRINSLQARPTKPENTATQPQKPQSANSIFDIPQSQFAKMQSQRGLNEKFNIGQWQSSDQGQFIKKKPTLTPNVSAPKMGSGMVGGVSPLLLLQQQIQKERSQNKPQVQGPPQPEEFKGVLSLEKFVSDNKPILDNRRYDNLLDAAKAGFSNALRYADAVDHGEVKRKNVFDHMLYYAGHGVKPITDIGYSIQGLITGEKHKISPGFGTTVFDTVFQVATEGKTKTHDPIGDYVKKDPLRTIVQAPAELAMWVTGGKAIDYGSKAVKQVSPIWGQTLKFPVEDKMKTVYRGLTYKDKPVFGWQNGKLVKGFDETKLPFDKIDPGKFSRYGWEASQSSGIASKTVFAEKTLADLVKKGHIPQIAKERAQAFEEAYKLTKGLKPKVTSYSPQPVEGLSQKQSDYLFSWAKKGQQKGQVDSLHGSTALHPQIDPSLRAQAGSHLKLGDIDLTLKTPKNPGKSPELADKMIREIGHDFPLEPKQSIRLVIPNKPKSNRVLYLRTKDGQEKKVFEIVLEERDAMGIKGVQVRSGDKVLDQKLSTKTVKSDEGLKLHSKRFQLQENMRTALGFHKGKETTFDIYPAEGRTKDVVRSYWNFKDDALLAGGEKGKSIDKAAEKIRSLYNIDFEDFSIAKDKVSLLPNITPSGSSAASKTGSLSTKPFTIDSNIGPKNLVENSKIPSPKSSLTKVSSKPSFPSTVSSKPSSISKVSKPSITSSIVIPSSITSVKGSVYSRRPSSRTPRPSNRTPSITSPKPSFTSPRPSITSPKPQYPSPKIPSITSPGSPKNPPKTPVRTNGGFRPLRPISRVFPVGVNKVKTTRKPIGIFKAKIKSTTDKKPGMKFRTHDFLGNTKTDHIVGLFRRKEVIHGDKKTDIQVGLDKKVNPWGKSTLNFSGRGKNVSKKNTKGLLLSNKKRGITL